MRIAMPRLGRGRDRRHAGRVSRARRPRRHAGRHGRRSRRRDQSQRLRITGPIDDFTSAVPAFTPETLSGDVGHDHPGHQGASHRGRRARAAPAPERRRLRHLGAERTQRARDRGCRRRRTHRRRVRELRCRLHGAGRDSLRRPGRGGGRRNRRPHHAAAGRRGLTRSSR